MQGLPCFVHSNEGGRVHAKIAQGVHHFGACTRKWSLRDPKAAYIKPVDGDAVEKIAEHLIRHSFNSRQTDVRFLVVPYHEIRIEGFHLLNSADLGFDK